MCSSETLPVIFSIVKKIMLLIQIVVPILLIIFASISLIKLVKNPVEKNETKKIINQFIAAVIVFFIPFFVDVVMNLVGEDNEISSCWNSAGDTIILSNKYFDKDEKERKKITYNATDYEAGRGGLDFSCTSKTVKAQFSCETLKIVEKHLYDFDATNFNSVINNKYHGDFGEYAKSVGGIFGEYYGKKMPNETEEDFQRAAEYVLGWMYMYGWEYMSHQNRHVKCRGNDCFYAKGGFVGKYNTDPGVSHYELNVGTDFDNVISGKNGGPGRMASECGDIEVFTFNKLGIKMKGWKLASFTGLKDLKVGDAFGMWNTNGDQEHIVIVGEVYDDRVVFYDTGSIYPIKRNYKRTVYKSKSGSIEEDKELLKKEFNYYDSYGIRRHHDFKKSQ